MSSHEITDDQHSQSANKDLREAFDSGDWIRFSNLAVPRLLAYLASKNQTDHQVRENIVQETLLSVYRNADKYRSNSEPIFPLLARIARRKAITMYRVRTALKRTPPGENLTAILPELVAQSSPPEEHIIRRERIEQLCASLDSEETQTLMLYHNNGLKSAAKELKLNPETLRKRIYRLHDRLRKQVASRGGDDV